MMILRKFQISPATPTARCWCGEPAVLTRSAADVMRATIARPTGLYGGNSRR